MGSMQQSSFVCIDCETTGLDPVKDQIIEVAAAVFTLEEITHSFETLVDPGCPIPTETIAIHHITPDMVQGKPAIRDVLPQILEIIGNHTIVGHGVGFDIDILANAAKRHDIPCNIQTRPYLDTLRMARLYGKSPSNSLEVLRKHFNITAEGAHRAMNDVIVNIEVFKYLAVDFKTTEKLFESLSRPIELKNMPLGKHKGRAFKELPLDYLKWAVNKDFDQDLIHSLKSELRRRKQGNTFNQLSNPFNNL
ncbi:MAG: dnaq1 [Chlamydiales bacterium]|jgi:DNA polymerase-3 subunit epsilon|nr:dnaq1 [Chlamydiales bacterium]